MATHKEVVKVWIAPGCIVCDACEGETPDVFDVQEESCVIRPAAKEANFLKPLTPSIISAAEGCPVEVIKFETIEVEGPEPWAGKEPAAAAAAPAGGAAAAPAKKAAPVSSGPPDPRWAGLLTASRTSGSRSAGGPAVAVRTARAPAEAVADALPKNAPPDAVAAAVVGSGFVGNRATVADRIRQKAGIATSAAQITRRGFSVAVLFGWGCIAAAAAHFGGAFQSFLIPKVTKEPPSSFSAGRLSDYPEPGVYENFKNSNKVWIVRLDNRIVAVSTICTHLGCIPNWLKGDDKFKCPCHGSGFYRDGVNFEGPAPRPLERFKVSVEGDKIVVDMSQKYRAELAQWDLPGSYIAV